ncbi:dynactin-associated protein-like [Myotis lucifugus]|uniref:dynactin-associated protein-like n=1 Tax=Myotis lucifugus TaxID=59463 RepID=UPI000CCC0CB5|nr:dynactin-associated protein-like [Myotis lucifugus]
MDRKHGKYIVNIEHSGNQPESIGGTTRPFLSTKNQEAHSSACRFPASTNVACDIGTNVTNVCTNTGTLGDPEFPNRQLQHCQVTRNFFSDWSLWKIFLVCLLACVITTAIGVLIVSLVYNGKNNSASIVIHFPSNHETTSSATETSSETTYYTCQHHHCGYHYNSHHNGFYCTNSHHNSYHFN